MENIPAEFRTALAPYLGPGYYISGASDPAKAQFSYQYNAVAKFDKTQFNPEFSLELMQAYNVNWNLGLTTPQIVAGIHHFGQTHNAKFPTGLTSWSNPVAVAGESILYALQLAGRADDANKFWALVMPQLPQGEVMANAYWQYTNELTAAADNAAQAKKGTSLFEKLVPAGMAFIGGPIFGAVIGAARAAGTGGDFEDILKGGVIGGGIGLFGGEALTSGLDQFTAAGAGAVADASLGEAVAETFPVAVTSWAEVAPGVFEATTIGNAGALTTALSVVPEIIPESSNTAVSNFQKEAPKMFEIDYSQDPFATTEMVNAGWNEVTGYGVDYYGQTGGMTDGSAVNDIFSTITKTLGVATAAIKTAGAAYAATRNATAAATRTQPNYTRAAGSVNIGMLALAGAAFFALKG